MKTSKALITVCVLIAVLALVQSAAGVFWNSNGSPYSFTNLHGEIVPMYGKGIYRDNPAFNAPIQRGTDAVALILYIPLLVAGIILYQRGSARGHLFLTGILASFVYHAASVAFGVAYNPLFLLYIALFSASLFAFVMAVVTFDQRALAARVGTSIPTKSLAVLLFISALGLLFAWVPDILVGLPEGRHAGLGSYSTLPTDVIDLGVIVPALVLAGILLLRRAPLGYLLASILTTMLILIGFVTTSQTIFQLSDGIQLGMGVVFVKGGIFLLLGLIGIYLMIRFYRSMAKSPLWKQAGLDHSLHS